MPGMDLIYILTKQGLDDLDPHSLLILNISTFIKIYVMSSVQNANAFPIDLRNCSVLVRSRSSVDLKMALALRQLCRLASRQVQRPRTLLSRVSLSISFCYFFDECCHMCKTFLVYQVCGSQIGQDYCRYLSLHEYQSIQLLEDAGVLTPKGGVASTPQQAYEIGEIIGKLLLLRLLKYNVLDCSKGAQN